MRDVESCVTRSFELHCHHIPLSHEVLQALLLDLRRGPAQLRHGSEGKERQPCNLNSPLLFLDLFLYLSFFFSHREGGGEKMGDHAREGRLHVGVIASFIAP
jgi:hypothetical protein